MSALEDFMRARAMRASPDYAKYMMQTDAERATAERSHPSSVAQAYSAIQQFMADKQKTDKAMHEFQTNQGFRAPQSLESFNATKPQYKQPSPLEQWKTRLEAMMQSGNPVLQKEAIGEMQSLAQEEVKPTAQVLSTSGKVAVDMGYVPGTKAFNDFVRAHAMKVANTSIKIGEGSKPLTREEILSLVDNETGEPIRNAPVNITPDQVTANNWSYGNRATEGEAKSDAAFAASQEMLDRLSTLTSSEGGADITGFAGVLDDYRSANTLSGVAIDTLMNVFGVPMTPENAEAHSISRNLGSQLIQAMRGANVGPVEIEQFLKQLPVAGQPKPVFEANAKITKQNLVLIDKIKASSRGRASMAGTNAPPTQAPNKVVPTNASKGVDGSLEWSDKKYNYKKTPEGKVFWRAK